MARAGLSGVPEALLGRKSQIQGITAIEMG
jgi:hypothetical protein